MATPKTLSTTLKTLEVLKFQRGKFVLAEVGSASIRLKLSRNAHWTSRGDDSYETTNLGAAAVYRTSGDPKVERIFARSFQAHYDVPRLPSLPGLDPHQRAGLEWVLARKRSYLAHAPGAGKTATAILAAHFAAGPGQNVFIVPPSLTVNWEREIRRFTEWVGVWPAIGIVGRSGDQDSVAWRADFLIVPDSMLAKEWVYTRLFAMKKKLVAVDEASRFKEPTAERSLAFYGGTVGDKSFPGLFRDARHVVFLDGSPMPNRPMELWAPTFALHPEAIGCMTLDDFGYRYCGAKPNDRGVWEYKYSSHEDELRARLRKDFMHVVTEDELSHPERRRSILFMNQDARSAEHKSWERRHLDRHTFESVNEDASQGDLARFRRELGIRKVPWVARRVRELLEEKNESILLFCWHREVVDLLAHELSDLSPGIVYGGVKPAVRERYFERFQAGKRKLIIGNIDAMGRGHNLQRADRVVFGEYSWTDELNRQCEKRASRRGSERDFVRCEYIVSPGSMDERVLSSVFTKQRRVERIIG